MTEKILLNPITETLKTSINASENILYFAVPFISRFAQKILLKETLTDTKDKRIITRFDETNINTFNLPTLEYLINKGFKICFNNNIHLKLYITDNDAFVTSSNLTNGGFNNNIELTVKVNSGSYQHCKTIFNDLWSKSKHNTVSIELIAQNMEKYEVLKKRHKFEKPEATQITGTFNTNSSEIQQLIDLILNSKENYKKLLDLSYEANKARNTLKDKLIKHGFDLKLFYTPIGHQEREKSLFYSFVYGRESKLAGIGLREAQLKEAFEHAQFKNVIHFLLPEILGLESWNLEDDNIFAQFCNSLFDFKIPQYSVTLPIRLASFFYPEYFISIFNLNHIQKACEILGLQTNAKTNGQKLSVYNRFLRQQTRNIPYNNYIKSTIIYEMRYSVELYKQLDNGEDFQSIKEKCKKKWIKNYIEKGKSNLEKIQAMQKSIANNQHSS